MQRPRIFTSGSGYETKQKREFLGVQFPYRPEYWKNPIFRKFCYYQSNINIAAAKCFGTNESYLNFSRGFQIYEVFQWKKKQETNGFWKHTIFQDHSIKF